MGALAGVGNEGGKRWGRQALVSAEGHGHGSDCHRDTDIIFFLPRSGQYTRERFPCTLLGRVGK